MNKLIPLILILIWSFQVKAASFNCSKAASLPEIMICNDIKLSKMDDDLGIIYKKAKKVVKNKKAFKKQSFAIWKWREENCRTRDCLISWYEQRKISLEKIIKDNKETGNTTTGMTEKKSADKNQHSHSGRVHSHSLPKVGIKHRHGNGAYGVSNNNITSASIHTAQSSSKKRSQSIQQSSSEADRLIIAGAIGIGKWLFGGGSSSNSSSSSYSSSSSSSYEEPCYYADGTCYKITKRNGRFTHIKCIKGGSGYTGSLCQNDSGYWSNGCGGLAIGSFHYKTFEKAAYALCK